MPIEKPEDLAGLKFRVPNNPLWVEFFKKLGAAPTPMAFAEVYNALQLKVVDGQENPISVPLAAKFFEVQGFVSITNHMADAWVLGINPAKFDALTDAEKTAIIEAAKETEAWKAENDAASAETTIKELEGHGMKVNRLTPEQQAAFRRRLQGTVSGIRRPGQGSGLLRQERRFRRQEVIAGAAAGGAPAARAGCGSPAQVLAFKHDPCPKSPQTFGIML